jgi:hypothetical protein
MLFRSLLVVLALACPAYADDLDRATTLADHFYRAGEYYRAITSYEELALFATDEQVRAFAALRIAMSYHHGRQHADAIEGYDAALTLTRDPDLAQGLRIQRALVRAEHVVDEPGSEALDAVAAELAGSTSAGPHQQLALYSLARIQLLDGRRSEATRTSARLTGDLAKVFEVALARPSPSRRSPWLGLAMSVVVPGSGSVYGGNLVDGMYYLGLTSLTGLGAWEVYDTSRAWTDQKVTFYGLVTVAVLSYAANVMRGYVAVARRNEVRALAHRQAIWRETDQPLPLETYAAPVAPKQEPVVKTDVER